ncbi:fatty acid/sphingolipid desaturase [Zopfia rhizophila CBS 207.26]|uniref:Delta 8-(E)-sphingolipid desaturase n=1 Tax=Zopfia rhizophila CBS 207.26 TaxID=1314779 RepID=A0A6A6EUM0_9PEZI|nr:fatty acid/sphingolipid desaturase [Zopfia rhizophila CBS 207.26]
MNPKKLFSPKEIEARIAEDQLIVLHEGYILKLDQWIDEHPGGRLAILHMVGRDATDEINVYHSVRALQMMKKYRIGRIEEPWTNLEPPIRSHSYRMNMTSEKRVVASADSNTSRWGFDISSLGLWKPELYTSAHSKADLTYEAAATSNESLAPSGECGRRISSMRSLDTHKQPNSKIPNASSGRRNSRVSYVTALEHKEIGEGLLDYPSLDVATQQFIMQEYRNLHKEIKNKGLYQCCYNEYAKELLRYSLLFCTFLYLLSAGWYLTSAIVLGMFWQQIMFTAHDAGHRGITGNFIIDTLIGAFIADFCCGLSIGWWKSSHNIHHLVTNMPEHDPDIQNIPLFSTSPTFMKSIFSSFYNFVFVWDGVAHFLVPYQKYTYYPIMAVARFNLYVLSWMHLMSPRAAQLGSAWWTRPVEVVFMICYWAIFGYILVWRTLPNWPIRIAFVLISHMITMLLHVQITLSHWGMPTSDLGPTESFPQRQLRTTMDIDCPAWLDFLHGGLQFQAVHHLFPRVPRHNLRHAQALVLKFCEKTGVRYQRHGFVKGNQVVLGRLGEVAKMLETLGQCQLHMAETGKSGLL